MKITLSKAFDPSIMFCAAKVACVVGPIITLVNQWDFLLVGHINVVKAALSFLIPYSVSTVSLLLAYSRVNANTAKAQNTKGNKKDLSSQSKRLDALIIILEQPDNQKRLLALRYKSGVSATDKSVDVLSELKYLQSVFKDLI